jgi:hypothetical protein
VSLKFRGVLASEDGLAGDESDMVAGFLT